MLTYWLWNEFIYDYIFYSKFMNVYKVLIAIILSLIFIPLDIVLLLLEIIALIITNLCGRKLGEE